MKKEPADIFRNRDWKPFSKALNEAKGFHPNKVYYNATSRQAAVVIDKSSRGDFALSQSALEYVLAAESKGEKVTEAFIVLRERGSDIVARSPALDVQRNLSTVDPMDGKFGLYWWIDRSFKTPAPEPEDAPF